MTLPQAERRARERKAPKFYLMGPDLRRQGVIAWEMENLQALLLGRRVLGPPVGERGFADFPETPRLAFKRLGETSWRMDKSGSLIRSRPRTLAPRDLEVFHQYWLVSDRMKVVLEAADSEAVKFVKCEVRNLDGSVGPSYWLCDVVRVLDAVDEERSRVKIKYDPQHDWKSYSLLGGATLFFKADVVGSSRIFRMRYAESSVICDQGLKEACKAAGLQGMGFRDTATC